MTTHGYFLDHIWLIPLFPAIGAAIMLLFGRKLSNAVVNVVCVGSVGVSFVYSLSAVWQLIARPAAERFVRRSFTIGFPRDGFTRRQVLLTATCRGD